MLSSGSGTDLDETPATATRRQVTASKAIQRRTGATFHLATRLLPHRVRRATYVLYAFFRVADDVVDDPDPSPPADQRRELERIRAVATGTSHPTDPSTSDARTDDAILAAFREVAERYDVPDCEIDEFVDAMARDVEATDYERYADLEGYLRGSSVAVANMMLAVMDPDDAETARPHARALAEAFQLTNFARDVREDVVEYDRVYIPAATLAAHGLTTDDVRDLEPRPELRAAVRDELRRAEDRYRDGVAGIALLPEDCQLAVLLSATLYAEHHRLIRDRDFDVASDRPSLSSPRRLLVLARTWLAWLRLDDPEAVFYRISPVAENPTHSREETEEARGAGRGAGRGVVDSLRKRTPRGVRSLGAVVPWVGE